MKQVFVKWNLFVNKKIEHSVKSIDNGPDGLSIILSDYRNNVDKNEPDIKINFGYNCVAYRLTDEGLRLRLYEQLKKDSTFDFSWGFYKVENSDYISWLKKESSTLSDIHNLVHYSIFDDDFVVDILSSKEPDIKIY